MNADWNIDIKNASKNDVVGVTDFLSVYTTPCFEALTVQSKTYSIIFYIIGEKPLEIVNKGGKGIKSKNKCQGDAKFRCVGLKL